MRNRADERSWSALDSLTPRASGGCLGAPLVHHAQVTSTNDLAREAAAAGAPAGLVVSADEQTRGRGRLGRTWQTPPGAGVLCSLVLRPALPPALAARPGFLVALAAASAVEQVAGVPAVLKWPNDLVVHGRKVAGLLAESGISGRRLDFVVVGIGINVHWHPEHVGATSLDAAAGRTVARRDVLAAMLASTEAWLPLLEPGSPDRLLAAWRGRLITLGRAVEAHGAGWHLRGQAVDVTPEGGLVLVDEAGRRHLVHAADVTLQRGP